MALVFRKVLILLGNQITPCPRSTTMGQDVRSQFCPLGQVSREVMERTIHSQGSEPCQPHCSVKGLARKGFWVRIVTLEQLIYPNEDQKVGWRRPTMAPDRWSPAQGRKAHPLKIWKGAASYDIDGAPLISMGKNYKWAREGKKWLTFSMRA